MLCSLSNSGLKIELQRPEDIEIGGEVFTLDLSDEAIERLSKGSDFMKKLMGGLNGETLDDMAKCAGFCREFVNGVMVDEPFDRLYAAMGKSTVKVVLLIPKLLKAYTDIAKEAGKALK